MTSNEQLVRVRVTYDSESELDDDGYSFSRETTVWHGVGAAGARDDVLAKACHRAAIAYPEYVSRLLLGIIGVSASGEHEVEPAFFVRPVGPKIIEMGALEREDGELFYPVTGGLLAVIHSDSEWDAKLSFEWRRESDREIFETKLIGFRPAIAGHYAPTFLYRARALIYRFTQSRLHAIVMFMFHRWVRRHREALLRAYEELEA